MNNDQKVFDVMRPGTAPAEPSSRPIITAHNKPTIPDDQFVGSQEPNRNLSKHNKVTLTPIERPAEEEDPLKSLQTLAASMEDDNTPPHKIADAVPPETRFKPEDFSSDPNQSTPEKPAEEPQTQTAPDLPVETTVEAETTHAATTPEVPSNESSETAHTQNDEPVLPPATKTEASSTETSTNTSVPEPSMPTATVTGNMAIPAHPPEQLMISHHAKPASKLFWVLVVIGALVISAIVINFLLDANVLPASHLPHTNIIG